MKLSANFSREEFERSGRMPEACVESYRKLCSQVLESVRTKFGRPVNITSGYRSPEANARVGGSPASQHVANLLKCAADFQIPGISVVEVFDWIRLKSGLPFDQLILEFGSKEELETDDCIHVSWTPNPRRIALVGATRNRTPYVRVEVA